MAECSYHYEHIKCVKQARFFIRLDGRNDPICEWHRDPKFWPKDVQRNLLERLTEIEDSRGDYPLPS